MFKYSVALLYCLIFLGSCSPTYYQYVELSSSNVKEQNEAYIYEDDRLKILYNFFAEDGQLSFVLYNKSEKPIYIDWKKSSFILQGNKYDYWIDEVVTKSKAYYGGYQLSALNRDYSWASAQIGISLGASASQRPERVTFIPPNSAITVAKFSLFQPSQYFSMKSSHCKQIEIKEKEKSKTINTCELLYSKENTHFTFRNYLTYSTTEDFEVELTIDNDFYATKIIDLKEKDYYKWYVEKMTTYEYFLFEAPNAFYLKLF